MSDIDVEKPTGDFVIRHGEIIKRIHHASKGYRASKLTREQKVASSGREGRDKEVEEAFAERETIDVGTDDRKRFPRKPPYRTESEGWDVNSRPKPALAGDGLKRAWKDARRLDKEKHFGQDRRYR